MKMFILFALVGKASSLLSICYVQSHRRDCPISLHVVSPLMAIFVKNFIENCFDIVIVLTSLSRNAIGQTLNMEVTDNLWDQLIFLSFFCCKIRGPATLKSSKNFKCSQTNVPAFVFITGKLRKEKRYCYLGRLIMCCLFQSIL